MVRGVATMARVWLHDIVPIDEVRMIDYEYGGPNYLAFDLADHFTEFAGDMPLPMSCSRVTVVVAVVVISCSSGSHVAVVVTVVDV